MLLGAFVHAGTQAGLLSTLRNVLTGLLDDAGGQRGSERQNLVHLSAMQSRVLLASLLLAVLRLAAPQSELRQDESVGLSEPDLEVLIPEVYIPTSNNGEMPSENQPCPGTNQDFEFADEPTEPNTGVTRRILQPSDLVRAALPSTPRNHASVVSHLLSTAWRQLFKNPQSLRSRHKRTMSISDILKKLIRPPSTLHRKTDHPSTQASSTLEVTTRPLPMNFAVDLPNPVVHRLGVVPITDILQTTTSPQDQTESSTKDVTMQTEAKGQPGSTEEPKPVVVPTAHRSLMQLSDSGATERHSPELLLVLITLIARQIA